MTDLDRIAQDAALRAELPILENAAASAAYLRQILTPQGELPPIGMSAASEISRTVARRWRIAGAGERHVLDRSAIFEDRGQAIYSSSKGAQLYVLFQAAQNLPAGKRHADELSFVVHKPRPLVAGRQRAPHVRAQRAGSRVLRLCPGAQHLLRDGLGVRFDERPELDVVLTGFSNENGAWRVSGRSDRFLDGASLERTVVIDKSAGTIRVRYAFSEPSDAAKTWLGFLHFAPDLAVRLDESSAIARDPAWGREMRIAVEGAANLRVVAGQEDPLQGWVVQDDRLLEAPVVEFETSGSAQVAMAIAWR